MARKTKTDYIQVVGAKENNLRDININIPKNQLVVITGLSGSGKSSLAFNTIYAEGQRRYMETFSSYARQFLGSMDRPEVEKIEGLSPVISIEQKTTAWNPRSTVGTTTEVYDFLRLLYARIGEAYSYVTGKRMVKYSEPQIIDHVMQKYKGKKIVILAPLIRGRKGHYRELFDQTRKKGFTKVRVDGKILDLKPGMKVDRFVVHDIEVVVDRIKVDKDKEERVTTSIRMALDMGHDMMMLLNVDKAEVKPFSKQLVCPDSGISYEEPSPNTFSFNSPYGTCPECRGLGEKFAVDLEKLIPDDTKSINDEGILAFGEVRENHTFRQLRKIAKKFKFTFSTPIKKIPKKAMDIILHGGDPAMGIEPGMNGYEFAYNLAEDGIIAMLEKWYDTTTSEKIRNWSASFMKIVECPECHGYRIKKESRHFKLGEKHIGELASMDIETLSHWMQGLHKKLDKQQNIIAKDVLKEINDRLKFLEGVGLHYLNLNRPTRTLSGGESQRTRLATQIGSQLTGITYILDEPSIGLHQRDNQRLITALKGLTDIGNTVLVVEHDKDIMMAADYIIDLGPGAGKFGGEIVAEGTPKEFTKTKSITASYLNNVLQIPIPNERRKGTGKKIVLKGASGNNLQNVTLTVPLGKFICVTGVSGSGKSTLINETLYTILRRHFYKSSKNALPYKSIKGLEHIDKVIEIDQSPIGRTPRSNPATYTKVFTDIRKLFGDIPEAKIRGYKIGRFSFNVKGGRCETCQGGGMRTIEMNFLPDVLVECETCLGRRYNRETLEILYKGKSISDVLNMTVKEAAVFFSSIPKIHRKLKTLDDVGLGYITLGQQATTLSGGEAQRVKLSEELSKKDTGNTIYILDEPTTGLHFEDIKQLIKVLDKLVDKGNTILVIEHNLDVVKVADHIIDIGPDGGTNGGEVVFEGSPEELIKIKKNHTAKFLKLEMQAQKN